MSVLLVVKGLALLALMDLPCTCPVFSSLPLRNTYLHSWDIHKGHTWQFEQESKRCINGLAKLIVDDPLTAYVLLMLLLMGT